MSEKPLVAVLMGSDSDLPVMEPAVEVLDVDVAQHGLEQDANRVR